MSKRSVFIPELPCEKIVRRICGNSWRNLEDKDMDAAWGVAIVRTIVDGIRPELKSIAESLGVDHQNLVDAFARLERNGCFLRNAEKIRLDLKNLNGTNDLAWYYYGGIAAGATGLIDEPQTTI